jgi:hypothetical protein
MRLESVGYFKGTVNFSRYEESSKGTPTAVFFIKENESGNDIYFNAYLFSKDAEVYNDDTMLPSGKQLRDALGWSGDELDSFATGDYDGKQLSFETREEEFNNRITVKVVNVWRFDLDVPPRLKPIDQNALARGKAKFPVKQAAPVAAAKKVAKANPTKGASSTGAPSAVPKPAIAAPSLPKKTSPSKPSGPPPCSKEVAWMAISEPAAGGTDDPDLAAEAWQVALNIVAPTVEDLDTLTMDQWGQVREKGLKIIADNKGAE